MGHSTIDSGARASQSGTIYLRDLASRLLQPRGCVSFLLLLHRAGLYSIPRLSSAAANNSSNTSNKNTLRSREAITTSSVPAPCAVPILLQALALFQDVLDVSAEGSVRDDTGSWCARKRGLREVGRFRVSAP
jgi:hypothetical protein